MALFLSPPPTIVSLDSALILHSFSLSHSLSFSLTLFHSLSLSLTFIFSHTLFHSLTFTLTFILSHLYSLLFSHTSLTFCLSLSHSLTHSHTRSFLLIKNGEYARQYLILYWRAYCIRGKFCGRINFAEFAN